VNGGEARAIPRSFETWVYAAALDIRGRHPTLECAQPGTFSEAVAFLLSDDALAPDAEGYPASLGTHEEDDEEHAADLLAGSLYAAAFLPHPAFGEDLSVPFASYFAYDVTTPEQDRLPRDLNGRGELGTLVGLCVIRLADDNAPEHVVFHEPHLPLRLLSCRNLADLRRVHELVLRSYRQAPEPPTPPQDHDPKAP
jgi:hypothetical protein